MKRDFTVKVKSKDGKGFTFKGKGCDTIKSAKVRFGLTDHVVETLDCNTFRLMRKKK